MPWLASGDAQALLLTVKLAATTPVILVAVCLPLAWLLVRRDPRGRSVRALAAEHGQHRRAEQCWR